MARRQTPFEANHCSTGWELMVRFALWANGLDGVPDADRIRVRYGVSRATAYRWRAAYCAATGVPTRTPHIPRLTRAQLQRARREAIGLRKALTEAARCRHCEFNRPQPGSHWWTWCRRNDMHVRPSHLCNDFRSTTAGGNRHP